MPSAFLAEVSRLTERNTKLREEIEARLMSAALNARREMASGDPATVERAIRLLTLFTEIIPLVKEPFVADNVPIPTEGLGVLEWSVHIPDFLDGRLPELHAPAFTNAVLRSAEAQNQKLEEVLERLNSETGPSTTAGAAGGAKRTGKKKTTKAKSSSRKPKRTTVAKGKSSKKGKKGKQSSAKRSTRR